MGETCHDACRLKCADRPLRQDIKLTDRFNRVAPELKSDRIVADVRKDIENAPAHGKVSVLFHKILPLESQVGEFGEQLLK